MKEVLLIVIIVIGFFAGFWLGAHTNERVMVNRCESTVVTSIMEGKPFMFLNERPVVVMATLRGDGTAQYRASMAEGSDR